MQEFLVKYAHKYAQKTKICKNVLKYALNMQKQIIFNKMLAFQTK